MGRSRGQGQSADLIVGRDHELAVLDAAIASVNEGSGRTVALIGSAGMGKTRLLGALVERARAAGFDVNYATARPLETERPLGVIVDALGLVPSANEPERARLGRMLRGSTEVPAAPPTPTLASSAASDDPLLLYRVVEEVLDLIDHIAARRPVLLALDDFHWTDQSSRAVVDRLRRRTETLPVLLAYATRPASRSDDFEEISVDPRPATTAIDVRALSPVAARDLARVIVGAELGPRLASLVERAGGSPLFIGQLIGALSNDDLLEVDEGLAETIGEVAPPSLRLTVLHQLRSLDADAFKLLQAASVLGTSFDVADLSVVTRRAAIDVVPALDVPIRTGVLVSAGDRLAFAHDLVREAIYEELAVPSRKALHLAFGRDLAAAGKPIEYVAGHLMLGADVGDHDAVELLREAARRVAPRSSASASVLLKRAVDIAGPDYAERGALIGELAQSLVWTGRLAEATPLMRETLARTTDVARATQLRLFVIRSLTTAGKIDEAKSHADAALSAPGVPDGLRAELLAEAAAARALAGDLGEARPLADESVAAGERAADEAAISFGRGVVGLVELARGDVPGALRAARVAVEHADRDPTDRAHRHHTSGILGMALAEADEFDEALAVLRRGRVKAEQLDAYLLVPGYHAATAALLFHAGRWDDAVAEAQTAVEISSDIESWTATGWAHAITALIATHRDDAAGAARAVAAGHELLKRAPAGFRLDWLFWATALVAEMQSDVGQAAAILGSVWDGSVRLDLLPERLMAADLARIARSVGDEERAQAVAQRMGLLATRVGTESFAAAAARCAALASGNLELYLAAAERYARSPRVLERALASEEAGAALVDAGRPEEAINLLRAAAAVFERLGAVRDERRATALLRRAGVRSGRMGRRRGALTGWASLTRTEREVAQLVSEGLRNREIAERLFISPRTVETHLAHLFGKLAVGSRVELALAARRAGD